MKPIYLPFSSPRWHLKLGLQPLNLANWIEIDQELSDYLRLKAELLDDRRSEVLGGLPGSEAAQREVLDLLLEHLPQRFPEVYQLESDRMINLQTQQVWRISDFAARPLELAGRLVQEDLCLMQPRSEEYVLVAGSVCFPFHWWFPEKLGLPLAQIHAPVPEYDTKLNRPVNNFFDRLQLDHPGYRLNWGLVDSPNLCLANHQAKPLDSELSVNAIGDSLWIRVERQTLRRLAKTNHILFTVRTYIYPLSILEQYPTMAKNLLHTIQEMPSGMQQYKKWRCIIER
ncbi:heme-dependent oxidative N-demethylase family protein [Egbenema bharatensis]|uniref:heme-dependent oxidative N-demethylase family protein n=1 Tax=Egbenema bharatensis TaxID=3463334 RepID=UPI003A87B0DE